jgi:ABC-type branched-subunit amino acid transport system substrate-binding protein
MTALVGVALLVLALSLIPGTGMAETKTLKVGALINESNPTGVDFRRYLEAIVPFFNESGGLVIGGEPYNIEMIRYDTKGNTETARAAVERLISRDQIKFILSDETIDAWVPLTEANKVVVIVQKPSTSIYDPRLKYVFEGSGMQTQTAPAWGWLSDNFKDLKTFAFAFPDNIMGHGEHDKSEKMAAAFSLKVVTDMYYPPDINDFTSMAARIKKANADCFVTGGGGPTDIRLYKGLNEAGWKGRIFAYLGASAIRYGRVIPLSIVEGLLGSTLDPFEFGDDSLSPMAKKAKDAWTAKHGKFENPYTTYWLEWDELIAGLRKANSLDTDKVAAAIGGGMEFDAVFGKARMVARPDCKNSRTVSAIVPVSMLKIAQEKSQLIKKMNLDEVYKYNKQFYKW